MSEQIVIPEVRLRYTNHMYQASGIKGDPTSAKRFSIMGLVAKGSPSGILTKEAFDRIALETFKKPQWPMSAKPFLYEASLKFPDDPFYIDYYCLSMNRR